MIPKKVWTHLAVVHIPNGRMTLFANGVEATSRSAPPTFSREPSGRLRLGCDSAGGAVLLSTLDDVRVYHRALLVAEVAALARK